jgi:hypothetical protein
MTKQYDETCAKVVKICDEAVAALEALGCSNETALVLLATQSIFKMTDLKKLEAMRTEINSAIICNDDRIDDDDYVVLGIQREG